MNQYNLAFYFTDNSVGEINLYQSTNTLCKTVNVLKSRTGSYTFQLINPIIPAVDSIDLIQAGIQASQIGYTTAIEAMYNPDTALIELNTLVGNLTGGAADAIDAIYINVRGFIPVANYRIPNQQYSY